MTMGDRSTETADVYLLTKPPGSERSELCMKLLARSQRSKLYLVGDGVYHLLDGGGVFPPSCEVRACKEDVAARGVVARIRAEVTEEFYEILVEDMMEGDGRFFTF
jgi:tRNA 2-thiouridine synthesizing protein B